MGRKPVRLAGIPDWGFTRNRTGLQQAGHVASIYRSPLLTFLKVKPLGGIHNVLSQHTLFGENRNGWAGIHRDIASR